MPAKAGPGTRQEALEAFGDSFRALTGAVRRLEARDTHRPGEVSFAQYKLLFVLDRAGELTTGELALAAGLSAASVSAMLDALVGLDLVARTRLQADRRVVVVGLTERGRARVAERHAEIQPRWEAALAPFDNGDLQAAAAVLDRLTAMFNDFA